MPKKLSNDVPQTPMNLDEQIVTRLVTKIAEFDEIIMAFTAFRSGVHAELMDIHERVDVLENHSRIIKNKLDQSSFPSLLEEFIEYKRAQHKKPIKTPSTKRGTRRKKL